MLGPVWSPSHALVGMGGNSCVESRGLLDPSRGGRAKAICPKGSLRPAKEHVPWWKPNPVCCILLVAGRRNTAYKDQEPERGLATCAHFHSRPHRQRYNPAGEFYTVTVFQGHNSYGMS